MSGAIIGIYAIATGLIQYLINGNIMLTENKNTSSAFGVYSEVGKLKKLWYVHREWRMNALPREL
jgi:hypothetical protein